MDVTININCDNAAFGEDATERGIEVGRILRLLARELTGDDLGDDVTLVDSNGNTVGSMEVSE
jgi:hypothetical protein